MDALLTGENALIPEVWEQIFSTAGPICVLKCGMSCHRLHAVVTEASPLVFHHHVRLLGHDFIIDGPRLLFENTSTLSRLRYQPRKGRLLLRDENTLVQSINVFGGPSRHLTPDKRRPQEDELNQLLIVARSIGVKFEGWPRTELSECSVRFVDTDDDTVTLELDGGGRLPTQFPQIHGIPHSSCLLWRARPVVRIECSHGRLQFYGEDDKLRGGSDVPDDLCELVLPALARLCQVASVPFGGGTLEPGPSSFVRTLLRG